MIEVLITFVVLLVGLLGLIGLQARTQQAELESYQRGQALVLLQDMVDRMNANRIDAKNGVYYDGHEHAARRRRRAAPIARGYRRRARQVRMGQPAERRRGSRGRRHVHDDQRRRTASAPCSARAAASPTTPPPNCPTAPAPRSPGSGIHTITVAWQGVSKAGTALSTNLCGKNLYPERRPAPHRHGDAAHRRAEGAMRTTMSIYRRMRAAFRSSS